MSQITKPTVGATGWDTATDALMDQHNALDLEGGAATVDELAAHAADTTNVHGLYDVIAAAATGTAATDVAALQAAIDATPTGGRLFIPRGDYKINAALTVDDHISIEGSGVNDTFVGIAGGGDSTDPNSPFLSGTVIEQVTAATDILKLTGSGKSVNLSQFGLKFATGIAGNTGHGVNAATTTTFGGLPDLGVMSFNWTDIHVAGHDGDHYAFVLVNPMYGTTKGLHSYGGGVISTTGNHDTINVGNLVHIHPFGSLTAEGTAAGYLHSSASSGGDGGVLNLIVYIRPQVMVGGDANTAGTQYTWDDLAGAAVPQFIKVLAPDLESDDCPVRFGEVTEVWGHYVTGTNGRSETVTGFGSRSLAANPSATDLTALGYKALSAVTTEGSGTAVGSNALASATSGSTNTAIGAFAAQFLTTGSRNTVIGYNAGTAPDGNSSAKTITGSGNVFIGYQSGSNTGDQNSSTALGHAATVGDSATSVGNGTTSSGNNSVAVGAGTTASSDDATAVGRGASATANGAGAFGRDSSGNGAASSTANLIAIGTANHTTVVAGRFNVATRTPANTADAQGTVRDIATDDSFIYVKTSAGWKRAALSTF